MQPVPATDPTDRAGPTATGGSSVRHEPDDGAAVVRTLLKLGVNALAIWIAVSFVAGLEYTGGDDWVQLAILALVLGAVNGLVKPVVKLLSLPMVILTLGLFLIVVNIAMFAIVVGLSGAFELALDAPGGFGSIALGGVVVSVVVWVGELVLDD